MFTSSPSSRLRARNSDEFAEGLRDAATPEESGSVYADTEEREAASTLEAEEISYLKVQTTLHVRWVFHLLCAMWIVHAVHYNVNILASWPLIVLHGCLMSMSQVRYQCVNLQSAITGQDLDVVSSAMQSDAQHPEQQLQQPAEQDVQPPAEHHVQRQATTDLAPFAGHGNARSSWVGMINKYFRGAVVNPEVRR
jgi:hypothetical protein